MSLRIRMRRSVVAAALTVGAVMIVTPTPTSAQTPPLPGSAVPAASAPPPVPPTAPSPNAAPSAPPTSETGPPLLGAPSGAPPVPAGAAVGNTPQPAPVETTGRRWYGWQTLTLDALWMVGFVASLKEQNGLSLFVVSGADYLLGAPIVHWAHGHGVKGVGSLLMRITPVVVGLAVASGGSRNGDEGLGNLFAGFAVVYVGGVAAAAIDAAVLAHEDVPMPPPPPLTVAPRLSLTKGGATFGVGGAF